jgi:hypothetical protein
MSESSSGNRVIGILCIALAAAIALVAWLALRGDDAPAPPRPPEPEHRRPVDEPPVRPRPRVIEPTLVTPKIAPEPGPESPGVDERALVRLDVTVVGVSGAPAPDVNVVLLDPFAQHAGPLRRAELARTRTDDKGHAYFDVSERIVRVYAWAGQDAGATEKFRVSEETSKQTIDLRAAIAIHGRVVDPGQSPVAAADVRLIARPWYDDEFGLLLEAKSAADGSFELPSISGTAFDVAPRGIVIEARAKAWPATTVTVTADTLRAGEVVVQLERAAMLRGRLVWQTGEAVPGRLVRLADARSSVVSDTEGRFELPLPPGGGHVIVMPGNASGATRTRGPSDPAVLGLLLRGPAKDLGWRGGERDVDLGDVMISEGRPLHGSVVDLAERPVKAADVVLRIAGVQVAATQTDDAGKFQFDEVGDDALDLEVLEAPGGGAWAGRRHALARGVRADGGDVRVVLTGALSVHVQFLAQADRSPVVVPQVTLRAKSQGDTPQEYGWTWAGSAIAETRFEVQYPGTYDVTVELPGYEPATADGVTVSADREVEIDVLFRKKP